MKNSQGNFVVSTDFCTNYIDKPNESVLAEIKQLYNLDTLVAQDETITFCNATNFVSQILASSDLAPTIIRGNSIDIINSVQQRNNGANCYAHAVVLCQVLSALGFCSRYIFCYPIDHLFWENHVVTIVFSKKQKKWMLFDAAQNLYYTDNNGTILDVFELRTCLANGFEVNVNLLDIYWNKYESREKKLVKDKNLIYMMKNLYRFSCFQNSCEDRLAHNRIVNRYHLVPSNYIQTPYLINRYDKEHNVKYNELYISNYRDFFNIMGDKE